MNSLSLRVSTVKTGENMKKNADMRAMLVLLPKHYLTADKSYCQEFKTAATVPDQVNVVKNIFKTLGSDALALQFMADLYYYSALKHPVRNQIQKLLITASRLGTGGVDESAVVAALTHTLERLVSDAKVETESVAWNGAIASITGCLVDNFECGKKALRDRIDIVFPFLCASVQRYLNELGVLSSPSVRNEYYLYTHNAVRLILACVQEFAGALKQTHAEHLKQLNVVAREIILDAEIPMDPRTNAGILMAQIARLYDDAYETFLQSAKQVKQPNEIALCVGVINTFDQHDFQHMSTDIRDICSKIEELANAHATTPSILLCATRALYQVSKVILALEMKSSSQPHTEHAAHSATMADDTKLIMRKLLIFTFGYLEHHMDSVRHLCRDLLRNVIAAAQKIQFDFLLRKIYDACNSERLSLTMKCVVLQQTAIVLGVRDITDNCPTLFTKLFAEHLGRDFIVNNLYEVLMCGSHKELPYKDWRPLWCDYLLNIATAADDRLPDIESLVVKAVKCEPRVVVHIIELGNSSHDIPISTKLSALWAVRKAGIKLDNFNTIMESFTEKLTYSILSNCDETRIMALRLLVETHKTTEPLTPLECQHILTYVEYNANCQSPATRQKSLALLGKALLRCELNLLKLLKRQVPSPLPPTTSPQASRKANRSTSSSSHQAVKTPPEAPLMKFLRDFMSILVSNLAIQDANFSRRIVSLTLLEHCFRICLNCNLPLREMLPPRSVNTLADVLSGDTYEANKELVMRLLKLLEDELNERLIEQYQLHIDLPRIHELLTAVRPLDTVTGAYLLEFFCHRAEGTAFGDFVALTYNPTYFAALRWLLLELRSGLTLAKGSILLAAKKNPLHGLLFAVKHLLQHLDFSTVARDISWRILIAELIVLCKELTTVVAPVVNSASPEGHLPNDFGGFQAEYDAEGEGVIQATEAVEEPSTSNCHNLTVANVKRNAAQMRVTPQMVLLCAWRTVKEVSLILGEIVLRSSIQYSQMTEQFLVTKEQLLEIGEHFKVLLAETKHRGAFEQAYVGFCKLCCRLWRVEAHDLNSLPMQWLRELIGFIAYKDEATSEKICATRRSAGVPFMAQALITTELQLGSSKALHYCSTQLLDLCSTSQLLQERNNVEARTHAMNILRALFRCTDLSEAVGEFVAEGVVCALRAYDAPTWSEKNAATLLFAALITRIFGVQRTRGSSDDLGIRNKMTGRIFFLRYPKLYDYFLTELRAASELVAQQQKASKLHPLLLILSRLYPSALEGTESNLKLCDFIPYISLCAGSCELQTRYLAAKAVVALVSVDEVMVTILRRCADIVLLADGMPSVRLNVLHGHLLQLYWLLKAQTLPLDVELVNDLSCTLVVLHEKTQLGNAVILKVLLDIFTELLQRLTTLSTYPQVTIQQLLYFSTQLELNKGTAWQHYYPVLRRSFFIYNLHTLRLTLPYGAISDFLLNPPLTHASVKLEQAETCLNIILLVLLLSEDNSHHKGDNDILNELELSATLEMQFVQTLDAVTRSAVAAELRGSKALQMTLKELLQQTIYYPECATKAYAVLSLLDHFDFTLTQLIKESAKHTGELKTQLSMCVERLVLKQGIDYKSSQACLEFLLEIAQPWQAASLRLKASKILTQIAAHQRKALEKKKLTFLRPFISLMLALLMDDDYAVRDYTAKIVLDNLLDDIEMDNVVATMAQRLFLQHTADMLLAMKADDLYILDVFKMITESLSAAANLNDEQSNGGDSQTSSTPSAATIDIEVFDKSEANVFAEPHKTISDCIVVFRNTFAKRERITSFMNDYDYKFNC